MAPISPRTPVNEPVAFISDIHGRLDALDAVLDEARRRGVKKFYAAGDHLMGGPEPLAVWRRLMEGHVELVRGVGDSALCSIHPDRLKPTTPEDQEALARFLATRQALGELVLSALRKLPLNLRLPLIDGCEVLLVHGSPLDPFQEMSQDMSDDELLALVADDPADLVICGSTHVPFQRVIDEVHVVNVGSVGAAPEGRIAHYTLLTPTPGTRTVEQNWVEY